MSVWRLGLMLLVVVVYAGLSHWMMVFHAAAPWAVVVLLGPLWLTALGLASSRFGRWGTALALVVGVAGLLLIFRGAVGEPNRLYVMQHAGIHAVLCVWFASTLRGDGLSLIGQFAERIHTVTPDIRRYTAHVTQVWVVYFALMVVASIVIYLTMPFSAWSLFANLFTPASAAALFVGEYLLRYQLHPEFERTRMIDAVRAFYDAPVDPRASER